MTEQQQRFNEGKPKLSYFFASRTALEVLTDALGPINHGVAFKDYATALEAISSYLDCDDYALQDAAVALMKGLQTDEYGGCCADEGMHAAEFLAHVPAALEGYSAVSEYGEGKYARGNYRKGAPVTQYLDSALRHLLSRLRGERLDPESGKPHGAHALWNVIQALEQPEFRDDRLPPVKQEPDVINEAPLLAQLSKEGQARAQTLNAIEGREPAETFGTLDAELRMRNGKTVKAVFGTLVLGNRVRFDGHGFATDFGSGDNDAFVFSSFPVGYENARFVEVV